MNIRVATAVVAAMLSSGAWAQSQPGSPTAPQSAHPGSDPDFSSQGIRKPKTGIEARMTGVSAGTAVQAPSGESIGTVKDIVPDPNSGRPAYVVIATRSGNTAVPYATITPLFHDGQIVLDRSRLESAPRLRAEQLQNDSDRSWTKQSDQYWNDSAPVRR